MCISDRCTIVYALRVHCEVVRTRRMCVEYQQAMEIESAHVEEALGINGNGKVRRRRLRDSDPVSPSAEQEFGDDDEEEDEDASLDRVGRV